jgi:hypothetical protein
VEKDARIYAATSEEGRGFHPMPARLMRETDEWFLAEGLGEGA